MADNIIRWKRGDYVRLSKAVNKFNRQVNELRSKGIEYAPELKSYQSIKENIYTRKELNRIVNSMKRFNIETSKAIELESGEVMTAWEYHDIKISRNRARKYLEGKLEQQLRDNPYAKYGLETKEIETTRKTLASLGKIDLKVGSDLKRLVGRINRLGSYDIDMKKAQTYRENYMKLLDNMNNYENIDLLKAKLNSIKNPKDFYEYVSSNNILSDLWDIEDSLHDSNPQGQTYGGFTTNQDAFDTALNQLGLLEYDEIELTDLSSEVTHIL